MNKVFQKCKTLWGSSGKKIANLQRGQPGDFRPWLLNTINSDFKVFWKWGHQIYTFFFRGGGGGGRNWDLWMMFLLVPNKLRHQKTFLREFIPIFSPNNLTTKVFVIASNLLMNYDLRHISVSYYFKYVFSFLIKVYLYATSFVERSKYNIHG